MIKIPKEVWSGRPVDYLSLKIFSCPTYVHVQSGECSKLDSKSSKRIFLGIEKGFKGYRLWDPILKKMVTSRDVAFDEAFILRQNKAKTSDDSSHEKLTIKVEFDENSSPSGRDNDNDIDPQQQQ